MKPKEVLKEVLDVLNKELVYNDMDIEVEYKFKENETTPYYNRKETVEITIKIKE